MFNSSRNTTSFVVFMALAALLFASPVFALPWNTPLDTLADNLTGPTAGAIALIAMFTAGAVLVFGGEISDFAKRMIYLVIAITFMIGGATFLRMIGVLG